MPGCFEAGELCSDGIGRLIVAALKPAAPQNKDYTVATLDARTVPDCTGELLTAKKLADGPDAGPEPGGDIPGGAPAGAPFA